MSDEQTLSDYYRRRVVDAGDGSPSFATERDREAERVVATELGRLWNCTFHQFGHLCAIDWYSERHGRVIGVAEFKNRTHDRMRYPTVFLNVRKWLALQLASLGLGVPAIFVVQFTDALCYAPIPWTGQIAIAGCARPVKARSDVEPVFELPVADLIVVAAAM